MNSEKNSVNFNCASTHASLNPRGREFENQTQNFPHHQEISKFPSSNETWNVEQISEEWLHETHKRCHANFNQIRFSQFWIISSTFDFQFPRNWGAELFCEFSSAKNSPLNSLHAHPSLPLPVYSRARLNKLSNFVLCQAARAGDEGEQKKDTKSTRASTSGPCVRVVRVELSSEGPCWPRVTP